jgi:hypothetical protein
VYGTPANGGWQLEVTESPGVSTGFLYVPVLTVCTNTVISAFGVDPSGECSNGFDDDGDGLVDFPEDIGCSNAEDPLEKEIGLPCDDGLDNDDDGVIDYPEDPDCSGPGGTTEVPEPALTPAVAVCSLALVALRRYRVRVRGISVQ